MCDCLVALPSTTGQPFTLFAKNSDRPPDERQVIETSGAAWAVEQVSETRAISNRTTIAAFDAEHRHPNQPAERLVDPRLGASNTVLDRRPVTVELLTSHLRSHDSCAEPGWSVCMHVDGVEQTTASMIAELHADGGHRVWMLHGSPCQHEYVEVYGSRTATSPVLIRPVSSTVA